jgi:hypothetical protein
MSTKCLVAWLQVAQATKRNQYRDLPVLERNPTMMNSTLAKARRTLRRVTSHVAPAAAELLLRQQAAYEKLMPAVQSVKKSPCAQIVVGATIVAFL